MRRPVAALASALLLASAAPAAASTGASSGAVGVAAAPTRTVTYHGYQVDVPVGWPVVRLAARPQACVRFNRPAVYLGHPGDQAACPAHLVGGAPGLLIEPLDDSVAAQAATTDARTAPDTGRPATRLALRDGSVALPVEDAGVLVTAVHGTSTAPVVRRVLDGARLTPAAEPTAVRSLRSSAGSLERSSETARARRVVAPGSYTGKGFDACTAPSQTVMNAWRASSPYRSVGVYIGGVSRGCAQPNLTRSWVDTQVRKGWHLIPTYVGRQAPCTGYYNRMSYDASTARAQGRQEAGDAIAEATALGMRAPSAIYSDVEGYDSSNTACRTAVLSYVSGWTSRLHKRGFTSGVYSSASSGISDLADAYRSSAYNRPDHIWLAWWNYQADTDGGSYVPDAYWADHQRIHQYVGDTAESWGGYAMNIDRNFLDVTVGGTGPTARCPANITFAHYPDLRLGSRGRHVRAAECLLIERGFDRVRAGGALGATAQSAVNRLKSSLDLRTDGVLGLHTWTALLSTGSQPRLERGSDGGPVRRLQRALTAALERTVAVDGAFGPDTGRALRSYARTRGLPVTGDVGKSTWRALQNGR